MKKRQNNSPAKPLRTFGGSLPGKEVRRPGEHPTKGQWGLTRGCFFIAYQNAMKNKTGARIAPKQPKKTASERGTEIGSDAESTNIP